MSNICLTFSHFYYLHIFIDHKLRTSNKTQINIVKKSWPVIYPAGPLSCQSAWIHKLYATICTKSKEKPSQSRKNKRMQIKLKTAKDLTANLIPLKCF